MTLRSAEPLPTHGDHRARRSRAAGAGAPGPRIGRWAGVLLIALGGCTVGPDYRRPATDLPPAWKTEAPWHAAAPADGVRRGAWWTVFADPQLDALEAAALAGSPSLAIAGERLAQAQAVVTQTASALVPQVGLGATASRTRLSGTRPRFIYSFVLPSAVLNDFVVAPSVAYETDLFGKIRREVEAANAAAQQAQADLETARLVLTADVAAAYFTLRELDAETDTVRRGVALQRQALVIVRAQHDIGSASAIDVANQVAALESATTEIEALQVQRDRTEHEIAALLGKPAPTFTIAPDPHPRRVPSIPAGVPSDLLQRRPDIASAERAMAAANAQIGVAKAAFYPDIRLGLSGGTESRMVSQLLQAPSIIWSFGVSAAQVLYDGGYRSAGVAMAQSGYRAANDAYRKTVLGAMQEVQDGLTTAEDLDRAAREAAAASAGARSARDLARDRYAVGVDDRLDVIHAQEALVADERRQVQIGGQRLGNSVYLIKALGGYWSGSALRAPADSGTAGSPRKSAG